MSKLTEKKIDEMVDATLEGFLNPKNLNMPQSPGTFQQAALRFQPRGQALGVRGLQPGKLRKKGIEPGIQGGV